MIFSMTAFARESVALNEGGLTVELRSVNHRYLDCTFKLPDRLRSLEAALREKACRALSRGKLDCLFRMQSDSSQPAPWHVDSGQLDNLLAATAAIENRVGQTRPLSAIEILQYPGVCVSAASSGEILEKQALALYDKALAELAGGRQREGEKLGALILDRLQLVEQEVKATRANLPELQRQQRQRLAARIDELEIDADPSRLEQELVYLAQKADVDEELDRLVAHIGEVRHAIKKGSPCGRRLDFLMQELNREANTLSSKSTASSTTRSAVELKVLIEQMREQIQNIE